MARGKWYGGGDSDLLTPLAPASVRADIEDLHDLTTSIKADIAETSTRVFVLYKLNNGFVAVEHRPVAARGRRPLRSPGQPSAAGHLCGHPSGRCSWACAISSVTPPTPPLSTTSCWSSDRQSASSAESWSGSNAPSTGLQREGPNVSEFLNPGSGSLKSQDPCVVRKRLKDKDLRDYDAVNPGNALCYPRPRRSTCRHTRFTDAGGARRAVWLRLMAQAVVVVALICLAVTNIGVRWTWWELEDGVFWRHQPEGVVAAEVAPDRRAKPPASASATFCCS